MHTVLHIDGHGVGRNSFETDFISPGETAAEVLNRMGIKWRLERVPDLPPVLSPEAEQFIRTYDRDDPSAVLAVFWRYYSLEAEEFDTVEEAERFIENGEDYGSLAGEAIVDGDQITVWG